MIRMLVKTSYTPNEISALLGEQVDPYPSMIRCLLTLNTHYYRGTSPVCGTIDESQFELRSRKAPYWSLRVKGEISAIESGSEIQLEFSKPLFPNLLDLLFNQYEFDKETILEFLKKWLRIEVTA